LLRLL
jgi:hypothetical protein